MNDVDVYERLILIRDDLRQRRKNVKKGSNAYLDMLNRVEYAADMTAQRDLYFRLHSFLKSLSILTGVSMEEIFVSFDTENNSNFKVFSMTDENDFCYILNYPLELNGSKSYDESIDSDSIICGVSVSDIVRMSDGSEYHPKDIFKKAVMESLIPFIINQKSKVKSQNN